MATQAHRLWRAIGPGLLFSGAAVGVSHLVQFTRAGAMFGLALVGVIVLINVLKYPAFRFGIDYGHATRRSLMAGYRDLGLWAAVLGGRIHVLGGEAFGDSPTVFREHWSYDAEADRWREEAPMPEGRHGLGMVALEGRLHVIGGANQPGGRGTSPRHDIFAA
jgi:hypothetical protein